MRAGGCVADPSILHVAELAVDIPADADALEQGVRRRVAERAVMLEDDQLAACHLAARRRVVVLEHAGERGEEKFEIVLAEAGPLGKLRGDETVGAVERIGHDMLASHGAVVGAVDAVVALGLLLLFGFVGGGHAGDGDFLRHDRFDRLGEGDLHGAAHLAAIDAGRT